MVAGEIANVSGTLYDLQEKTSFGERIPQILADNVGFDINYCVNGEGHKKFAARYATNKLLTLKVLVTTIDAQWEGMGM